MAQTRQTNWTKTRQRNWTKTWQPNWRNRGQQIRPARGNTMSKGRAKEGTPIWPAPSDGQRTPTGKRISNIKNANKKNATVRPPYIFDLQTQSFHNFFNLSRQKLKFYQSVRLNELRRSRMTSKHKIERRLWRAARRWASILNYIGMTLGVSTLLPDRLPLVQGPFGPIKRAPKHFRGTNIARYALGWSHKCVLFIAFFIWKPIWKRDCHRSGALHRGG